MIIVYLHYSHLPLNEQLWQAACYGHTEEVVRLLGEGANPNWLDSSGLTAVHWACYDNHPQMLSAMIRNDINADPNIKTGDTKYTPLHYACERGSLECVRVLVDAGGDSGLYILRVCVCNRVLQ